MPVLQGHVWLAWAEVLINLALHGQKDGELKREP